jgi:type IX secretion system substrate protein
MKKRLLPLILLFSFSSICFSQTRYVDSTAVDGGDGMSWNTAYNDLQLALNDPANPDSTFVAKGTYWPDTPGGDVTASFIIAHDMVLLGGFPSGGGNLAQLDPLANPTILSGDLDNNDIDDDFVNLKEDNVETVVYIESVISNATEIDGFVIRNGHSDQEIASPRGRGGGLYSWGAPIIRHCIFEQNYAFRNGGGAYARESAAEGIVFERCRFRNNQQEPTNDVGGRGGGLLLARIKGTGVKVLDCIFEGNSAYRFGGLGLVHCNALIENDTFSNNYTLSTGGGFGMEDTDENIDDHYVQSINCLFEGNSANAGAGIFMNPRGDFNTIEILNCNFDSNYTENIGNQQKGGGMFYVDWGSNNDLKVDGCNFSDNISESGGGGMDISYTGNDFGGTTLIENSNFTNNAVTGFYGDGSAIFATMAGDDRTLNIKNCNFTGNQGTNMGEGALGLWSSYEGTGSILIDSCYFLNNISHFGGGITACNAWNGGSSVSTTITSTQFVDNTAAEGGAINLYSNENSLMNVLIEDCDFYNNLASVRGGAVSFSPDDDGFHAVFSRCVMDNNSSPLGSAIDGYNFENTPLPDDAGIRLESCLIVNHNPSEAVIHLDSVPYAEIVNSTIADNASSAVWATDLSSVILQNSISHNPEFIEIAEPASGASIFSQGGNIIRDNSFTDYAQPSDHLEENPLFVGSGDPCEYYNLQEDSPAIGHGVEGVNTSLVDLCGNDRVQGGQIDIGALESEYFGVSIKEVNWQVLEVYPNPVSTHLQIDFPEQVSQLFNISIEAIDGQTLKNQMIRPGQSIDVTPLTPGIYFLRVEQEHVTYYSKFVKI